MGSPGRVLPYPVAPWRSAPPATTAGPTSGVLVVDDDPRVRAAVAATILLEADLTLLAQAPDAAGALALVEGAEPFVALVDVALPDVDAGLDLIHTLAHRLGCPVVAMSLSGGRREAALAAGAVLFIEKDGDIDAVLGALRAASMLAH